MQAVGDDALLALRKFLSEQPEAGDVIQGTGGLRKVRVKLSGRGKSSGARAIYLLLPSRPVIALLYLYAKSAQTDLSPAERKLCARRPGSSKPTSTRFPEERAA